MADDDKRGPRGGGRARTGRAGLPVPQYAVRIASAGQPGGYYYAVLFSTREDLAMLQVVDQCEGRAGMEAHLIADTYGPALGTLRPPKPCAQKLAGLPMELAHHALIWARRRLPDKAARLAAFGIVRLINDVWAIPDPVELLDGRIKRVQLSPAHPQTHPVLGGLRRFLDEGQTPGIWAEILATGHEGY